MTLVASKQKFVVSNADFTPENRLYANDWKAVSLYTSIMDNLAIQTKPEGGALPTLLDKWIEQLLVRTAQINNISLTEIRNESYYWLIQKEIMRTVNEVTETGGFDFGIVIMKYYEGYIKNDEQLRRSALKWLKGEYRTKIEARQDLGVREIVNDLNYYDMLKNFCRLFVSMGYSGFIINLDEAVNLYKISTSKMREKNYDKILSIFNDCYQGRVSNLFINFAGTLEFLENNRRGLFSYNAIKTRLETNRYETLKFRDLAQPVIKLKPLNHNEIFVLLQKLKEIFDFNFNSEIEISEQDIKYFMEDVFNRPGAAELLTPREVIKGFLDLLSILRQNPDVNKYDWISKIELENKESNEIESDNIEEL